MERKREGAIRFFLRSVDRQAASYWRTHVAAEPGFDPRRQYLVMILLSSKWRCVGHEIITPRVHGRFPLDPIRVMRTAVKRGARAVVLVHNHPDPTVVWLSQEDLALTEELFRAAQQLRIRILDHVMLGEDRFESFRKLGYVLPLSLIGKRRVQ